MPILVTNPFNHSVELHSHCGNSVMVGAKARREPVANRFAWQVPQGVIVEEGGEERVDPCAHVRGRPLQVLANAPRTAEEAQALAARGVHPHHTVAARALSRRRAKEILSKNPDLVLKGARSESSEGALATGGMGSPGGRAPSTKPAMRPVDHDLTGGDTAN